MVGRQLPFMTIIVLILDHGDYGRLERYKNLVCGCGCGITVSQVVGSVPAPGRVLQVAPADGGAVFRIFLVRCNIHLCCGYIPVTEGGFNVSGLPPSREASVEC